MYQKILLSTLLLFASAFAIAQVYEFELSTSDYENITDPDFKTEDTASGILFHSPFKFSKPYQAFGQTLSAGFSIGDMGYVLSANEEYGFTFDPFLADLVMKPNASELRVKQSLKGRDSVLEVEWFRFGIADHPEEDELTFKMTLHRATGTIEFHYGPSVITKEAPFISGQKPIVVISHLSPDFQSVYAQYFLGGNPDEPTFLKYPNFQYIKGFPTEGTLYTIFDPSSSIGEKSKSVNIQVFPNPASGQVQILSDHSIDGFSIMDLSGRVLLNGAVEFRELSIDLTTLPKGLYVMRLNVDGTIVTNQLRVQ